ncbi:unknown [Clostridium sp. CAG:1193]|nr:unknown [Clostridium sp. CAG:1193]
MDVSGKYYNIEKITSEDIVQTVYNLEVKDNHNYYVTESKILVHNVKRAN